MRSYFRLGILETISDIVASLWHFSTGANPSAIKYLPHTFIITPIRVKEKFSLTFSERGTFGLSLLFPGRFFIPFSYHLPDWLGGTARSKLLLSCITLPRTRQRELARQAVPNPNGQLAQFGILSGNTYPAPHCRSSEARCVAIVRFVVFLQCGNMKGPRVKNDSDCKPPRIVDGG